MSDYSDDSFDYSDYSSDSFIDDNNYDDSQQSSQQSSQHSSHHSSQQSYDQIMDNSIEILNDESVSDIEIAVDDNHSNNGNNDMMDAISDEIDVNQRQTNDTNLVKEESNKKLKTEHKSQAFNQSIIYSQTTENNDNCCIICTEMWTTTTGHQLVSLSCGHLFGRSCIEKWLEPSRRTQRCPQCNKKAVKKDIRVIYARNLRALDTSERDRALEQLDKERQLRRKLELEANEDKLKLKSILKENERLKAEYMECQMKVQQLSSSSRNTEIAISNKAIKAVQNKLDIQYLKDIEINSSGECRLLGYSSLFEIIAVSQPNTNKQLFPGFGVKKIFLNDFKTDNICIHSKEIKDLELNAYDGTILTASLDKTVKLTSLLSKASIMSYNLEVEAWSVAFNPKNKHEFYAGLRNGQILLFDTRMMSSYVDHLHSSTNCPVVSLNYIDYDSSVGHISGVLSTQILAVNLHQRSNANNDIMSSNFSMINVPFDGRFTSADFEPKAGLTLLSCRPSTKHKKVTHSVIDLKMRVNEDNEWEINPQVVEQFEGGTEQIRISRSRIFAHPFDDNSALICAGDESAKGALIWDLSQSVCVKKLKSELPILDMSLLQNFNTNNYFMTALTEKCLKFYKCIS